MTQQNTNSNCLSCHEDVMYNTIRLHDSSGNWMHLGVTI